MRGIAAAEPVLSPADRASSGLLIELVAGASAAATGARGPGAGGAAAGPSPPLKQVLGVLRAREARGAIRLTLLPAARR